MTIHNIGDQMLDSGGITMENRSQVTKQRTISENARNCGAGCFTDDAVLSARAT